MATSQFPPTSLPRKTTRPFHFRRRSGFFVSGSFSTHIWNTMPMCILVVVRLARALTTSHSSISLSIHVSISRRRFHSFRKAACAPELCHISPSNMGRATQQFHGISLNFCRCWGGSICPSRCSCSNGIAGTVMSHRSHTSCNHGFHASK
jgi:hypothetical protein